MMQTRCQKAKQEPLLVLLLLSAVFLAMARINEMSEAIREAIRLCGGTLIPTLFPFMILSELLLSLNGARRLLQIASTPLSKLLHLSSSGAAVFLIGNLFGFPMGVKAAVQEFRGGYIDKKEAESLFICATGASPFFLIGSVGNSMFGSIKIGFFLYLSQLFTNALMARMLFRKEKQGRKHAKQVFVQQGKRRSFCATVEGAVKQTLSLCGYVLLFCSIGGVTLPFLPQGPFRAIFACLFEIGSGCMHASHLSKTAYAVSLCAFSAAFSGLSVYFQTLDCIEGTELHPKHVLLIRLFGGGLCAGISALLFAFFG